MSVPLSLLSGVRNLLQTLTPGVRPGNATPHEMQNGCSFIGDHRCMGKKSYQRLSQVLSNSERANCLTWDVFLPGILSFHRLRSIPWAHQMRLILGFLMERVTQMQTSFGRSGAEHLDLQIKDAEHLVERRTGISICLVLCNVSTHVIYIYVYVVGTSKECPRGMVMLGL